MFETVLSYLPRIVYSSVLIFLSGLFVAELVRVWTDDRLYLAPFDYERDGAVQREAGVNFARRVSQALRRVRFIYTGGGINAAPIASTDQIDRAVNLDLPDLPSGGLDTVEVQAYGVNFGALLRTLQGWVRNRNQIVGYVSHYGDDLDIQASISGELVRQVDSSIGTGLDLGWSLRATEAGDAAFDLACGIYRMVAASQSDEFRTVTDSDFCTFLRALEKYQEYLRLLPRNVPAEAKAKLLQDARELVTPLEGAEFPFASKLAGLIHRESGDLQSAEAALKHYLAKLKELGQTDKRATDLLDDIRKALAEPVDQPPPEVAQLPVDLKSKVRPLRPGLSLASVGGTAGTLCCLVVNDQGERFILTADHAISGGTGTDVVQPGPVDGGTPPEDVVGTVHRVVTGVDTDGAAAGALIALRPDVDFDLSVPGRDVPFAGTADPPAVGGDVFLVGRTSGLVSGKVTGREARITLALEKSQTVTFNLLFETTRITQPGDSGAPVFDDQNRLVGMAFAGGGDRSLIMPIGPVLDALEVRLAEPE